MLFQLKEAIWCNRSTTVKYWSMKSIMVYIIIDLSKHLFISNSYLFIKDSYIISYAFIWKRKSKIQSSFTFFIVAVYRILF